MKRAKLATWKDYFENTKNNPPRPLLIKALELVKKKHEALDPFLIGEEGSFDLSGRLSFDGTAFVRDGISARRRD